MEDLYHAAQAGDLERVTLLVEQGVDKNQVGGQYGLPALSAAAENNHFAVLQYLVEQGADIDKTDIARWTPLHYASVHGHLEVARYLLEQGADRDKVTRGGCTPLHYAAANRYLEIAKLLMVYGADLNARDLRGRLPIDVANTEEIKQAILNEPRRRMDEAPGKRATEQDRHPNTATSASAQEVDEEEVDQCNKRQRLDKSEADEGKVAEEDEDSEPSDEEDDD